MNVHSNIMSQKQIVNPIVLIREIQDKTGWKPYKIAEEAGVSHTTIGRNLKKDAQDVNFTTGTIRKLVDLAERLNLADTGFSEPEALPLGPPATTNPNLQKWRATGSNMIMAGILPGDELEADAGIQPKHNDIVIAQITDLDSGTTETVIRRYLQSSITYICAASPNPTDNEIVLVDNNAVVIMAVMTALHRERPR